MFERLLASILTSVLGEYVESSSFSQETIRLGVWSGNLVLENMTLKASVLDPAQLPLELRHGRIGRLELKIPLTRLGTDPIVATLEHVYVVVVPKYEWDE
ncbi:vacuolar protein sorting-associated protein 13A N-terminal domain-containing protein, partial [Tribonema minus]